MRHLLARVCPACTQSTGSLSASLSNLFLHNGFELSNQKLITFEEIVRTRSFTSSLYVTHAP